MYCCRWMSIIDMGLHFWVHACALLCDVYIHVYCLHNSKKIIFTNLIMVSLLLELFVECFRKFSNLIKNTNINAGL